MPVPYKDGLPKWKRPGVYGIVNTTNGKVYVGSSLSVRGRLQGHRSSLRRGVHDNTHLQRAWTKYGEKVFRFDLLEVCEAEAIIVKEQYWIDKLRSYDRDLGYNIALEAGESPMKGRTHSPETCEKLSKANQGKDMSALTAAAAEANRGKKKSQEFCDNLSEKLTGRVFSEEHKAAIKETHWLKQLTEEERSETMKEVGAKAVRQSGALHWTKRLPPEEVAEKQRRAGAAGLKAQGKRVPNEDQRNSEEQ